MYWCPSAFTYNYSNLIVEMVYPNKRRYYSEFVITPEQVNVIEHFEYLVV